LAGGLKQLDQVAGRVGEKYLAPARPRDRLDQE
jgi:hypothetical protein